MSCRVRAPTEKETKGLVVSPVGLVEGGDDAHQTRRSELESRARKRRGGGLLSADAANGLPLL